MHDPPPPSAVRREIGRGCAEAHNVVARRRCARIPSREGSDRERGHAPGIVNALVAEGPARCRIVTETDMLDLVLLASSVAFFLLSLAYVRGCERL